MELMELFTVDTLHSVALGVKSANPYVMVGALASGLFAFINDEVRGKGSDFIEKVAGASIMTWLCSSAVYVLCHFFVPEL